MSGRDSDGSETTGVPAPENDGGKSLPENPAHRHDRQWLPVPDLQRILPFENMRLYNADDPWQDLKEIGSCSLWVGCIFGLGTLLGQVRSGHGARAIFKRVCLGAGVGVVGIVGGCVLRDLTLKVVWEHLELCESLRDARSNQLDRKKYGDPDGFNIGNEVALNENRKPKPKEESKKLEEHETISEFTHWVLAGARVVLFCLQVKILSASTRFIAAGIYPYFLGRWLTKNDPQLSYMFAASMMRLSRSYYWVYAWPLASITLGSYKNKNLPDSDMLKTCRWVLCIFGVVLIWRYNRTARAFLNPDRKHYTVQSSAQYFLDSTRK